MCGAAVRSNLYAGNVAYEGQGAPRMTRALPVARGVELLSGAVGHLLSLPEVTSDAAGWGKSLLGPVVEFPLPVLQFARSPARTDGGTDERMDGWT